MLNRPIKANKLDYDYLILFYSSVSLFYDFMKKNDLYSHNSS